MRGRILGLGAVLCLALASAAEEGAGKGRGAEAEMFDLSGLPPKAETFDEQRIREEVKSHEAGNLAEAVRIQRRLAGWYEGKQDAKRAALCRDRAALGERLLAEASRPSEPPPPASGEKPSGEAPAGKPKASTGWSGKYFAMDGRTLHTWDFADDGTYLYTTVASGAGTSVRNSERGTYSLELKKGKGTIVLAATSEAGAFSTPGLGDGSGNRTTILGGGSEKKDESRRLSFELKGDQGAEGIVLAGKLYKPKRW